MIEDYKTEFKREFTDSIKIEILSFLNTSGGAIYVGLNDDGSFNSEFKNTNKDEIDLKLSSWIQEAYYPHPSNLISFYYDKSSVLIIEIKEGIKKPYYLKEKGPKPSGVYKRVGSSVRKASEDEILKMIMDSNKYDYENEISDEQDLTFNFLKKICENKKIHFDKKFLYSAKILTTGEKYTNLGFILSDQSSLSVKFAEYDDKMNFKVKKIFRGSILKLISDIEEQCDRFNDVSIIIDGSSFERKEYFSYPKVAIREIVINAFCHCDYFVRSDIKIEFFNDKLKITSPGSIYRATLEDILKGVQTYRNKNLVHLLDKLGYIENFGMGIPRTIESYKNHSVKPEFYNSENFFIVYLPKIIYLENHRQINRQINELGLTIMKIIKINPGIKVNGIFEKLKIDIPNLNLDKIRYEIKHNIKEYIELRGSKKTGGYFLKDHTEDNE